MRSKAVWHCHATRPGVVSDTLQRIPPFAMFLSRRLILVLRRSPLAQCKSLHLVSPKYQHTGSVLHHQMMQTRSASPTHLDPNQFLKLFEYDRMYHHGLIPIKRCPQTTHQAQLSRSTSLPLLPQSTVFLVPAIKETSPPSWPPVEKRTGQPAGGGLRWPRNLMSLAPVGGPVQALWGSTNLSIELNLMRLHRLLDGGADVTKPDVDPCFFDPGVGGRLRGNPGPRHHPCTRSETRIGDCGRKVDCDATKNGHCIGASLPSGSEPGKCPGSRFPSVIRLGPGFASFPAPATAGAVDQRPNLDSDCGSRTAGRGPVWSGLVSYGSTQRSVPRCCPHGVC